MRQIIRLESGVQMESILNDVQVFIEEHPHKCFEHNSIMTYAKSDIADEDGYTCFYCLEELNNPQLIRGEE